MEGYLGVANIDIEKSVFKNDTASDWAMRYIILYGGIDGAHHKAWLIDQIARILKGTKVIVTQASWENGQKEYRFTLGEPSKEYVAWRRRVECLDGPEDERCGYDEGSAP
jgi:hypothetical protein